MNNMRMMDGDNIEIILQLKFKKHTHTHTDIKGGE